MHIDGSNRDHARKNLVPRVLQIEPRAHTDGKLPEGMENLGDFSSTDMASAMLLDDDNPATDEHEYACVTWQDVKHESKKDPCMGRTARINSCLRKLFDERALGRVPRI